MYEMSVFVSQHLELVIRTFSLAALKLDAEFIQTSYKMDPAEWGIRRVKYNGIPVYIMSFDRKLWDDDGKEVK